MGSLYCIYNSFTVLLLHYFFCLPFSSCILWSICLLRRCILQFNNQTSPQGSIKFQLIYLWCPYVHISFTCPPLSVVTAFTPGELSLFYRMSKSPKSRSEAAGDPQVSSYRWETHRNQPSPIITTPTSYNPLKRDWKAGVTGLALVLTACLPSFFSSFLFPPLLPHVFVLSLSGEARGAGTSTFGHGGKKTKTPEEITSLLSFSFYCVHLWVQWNRQWDKICNK